MRSNGPNGPARPNAGNAIARTSRPPPRPSSSTRATRPLRALEAAPPEHRGWEWRYLHSQVNDSRAVIHGGKLPSGLVWQRPIISPAGDQLATVDRETNAIKLWNTSNGAAIGTLRGHEGHVLAMAYSPDGKRLVSGSADKTVRVWDPAAAREVAVLSGHQQPVVWLSYSPDGKRICSLGEQSGCLWDPATGQAIAVLGGTENHLKAAFTTDSRRLVVGLDRQVCLYDATTGRQVAVMGSHERSDHSSGGQPRRKADRLPRRAGEDDPSLGWRDRP